MNCLWEWIESTGSGIFFVSMQGLHNMDRLIREGPTGVIGVHGDLCWDESTGSWFLVVLFVVSVLLAEG